MANKNYYVVLGVPRTETLAGIRTAYRDLAKRFHPDLVGDAGTRLFQEIVEAYDVLSDPERRLAHDRDLDEAHRATVPVRVGSSPTPTSSPHHGFVEPLIPRRSPVEPLEDVRRRGARERDPYHHLLRTLFGILR